MRRSTLNSGWLLIGAIVAASGASNSFAQLRIPTNIVHRPPNSCLSSDSAGSGLESFRRADLASRQERLTYTRIVSADDAMALHAVSPALSERLKIRVFAKSKGTGEFEPVCEVAWKPATQGSYLLIKAPWHLAGSVWRYELIVEPQPVSRSFLIEFMRKPGSEVDPENPSRDEAWNDAHGLMCTGSVIDPNWRRRTLGFAGVVRLDVSIDNSGQTLSADQFLAVERSVRDTIPVWVEACEACRAEQIAIVSLNGQFYARPGLTKWSDQVFDTNSVMPFSGQPEQALRDALEPVIWLGSDDADPMSRIKDFTPYEFISDPGTRFRLLCATNPDQGAVAERAVQMAVCRPNELDPSERAQIIVRFVNGKTFCGDSGEIIACRADPELTEYNIRDFRFSFADETTPDVGTGPIQFDFMPVLAHEMGHWIGLGHIDRGESLMASSAEQARCINKDVVLAMLDNRVATTSQTEAFRLHKKAKRTH